MQANSFWQNIQRSLTFAFREPDAGRKILIALGLALSAFIVPLVPLVVLEGYFARIVRRIVLGDGQPYLPEWDDWEGMLKEGAKVYGAALIYSLPVSLIVFVFFFILNGATVLVGVAAESSGVDPESFVPLLFAGAFAIFFLIAPLLVIPVGYIVAVVRPHVIARNDFGAAFRFKEWWAILRANMREFFWSYLVITVVGLAVSFLMFVLIVTLILACLVPLLYPVVIVYSMLISNLLMAYAYRGGLQRLASSTAG